MKIKLNWDRLGITTSIICAIHCGFLPLLLPTLSLFGLSIVHNQIFEWTMIGIAFIVGVYALYHGYIKHHHQLQPMLIFFAGFSFLVAKQFFHDQQIILLSIAVPLIIYAHYSNYKKCSKNTCSSSHHQH